MRGLRVVSLIVMIAAGRLPPVVAADHLQTPPHGPAAAQVSVCFVPEQECDTSVAEAIAGSTRAIRVQAYGFMSPAILQALVDAWGRGVDVEVILDKSEERDHGSRPAGARFTADAGIPTWIDNKVAIAHNKVIIIDGHLVIGGSYNYTSAAEHKNAENVTFIDAPVVADFYLMNWEARKAVSRPSRFEAGPGADEPHVVASAKGR
jgi:phosphatidylserine/phosphatidylglycerophosphate/cardiolipin synthase-like enzyme